MALLLVVLCGFCLQVCLQTVLLQAAGYCFVGMIAYNKKWIDYHTNASIMLTMCMQCSNNCNYVSFIVMIKQSILLISHMQFMRLYYIHCWIILIIDILLT